MQEPSSQANSIPIATRFDGLRMTLFHLLPLLLQGLFTRNRIGVHLVQRFHHDPLSVRFFSNVHRKYDAPAVFFRRRKNRTLLLFDVKLLRIVLQDSPSIFAEADEKRTGMSRFQPHALTISRGVAWKLRRPFNQRVLASHEQPEVQTTFASMVREEVEGLKKSPASRLQWRDISHMFERITLGVIFGRSAREDVYLTRTLSKLMRNANFAAILPARPGLLDQFLGAIRGYVRFPEPNSLIAMCRKVESTEATKIESQIPHWMFAMHETLAINCVRALALLASDADVQEKVRSEWDADLTSHDRQRETLTGVLQEAMRLWPTTPLIVRKTREATKLAGQPIDVGTNVMIVNAWFHRSAESNPDGDQFRPEFWKENPQDDRFNHLSNGTQGCAGRELALFLGTQFLGELVSRHRITLKKELDVRNLSHRFNHFGVSFRCDRLVEGTPS